MQILRARPFRLLVASSLALALGVALGCSDSSSDPKPPVPPPTTGTNLGQGQAPPGIVISVERLSGATGPEGRFQSGDRLTVRYRVTKASGAPWGIAEFEGGEILVSGPTFNYQVVLRARDDLVGLSLANQDGSYSYTFTQPIPQVYAAPYNDSPSFGPEDGELTGQALLGGTYTVGLNLSWRFTVEGQGPYHDVGSTTADFLLGGALAVEPREVVLQQSCSNCHGSVRAHEGKYTDVRLCVLCHTSGAEDDNTLAGGTPGVSVDLRVMIHKLHSGKHLPSVLGVSTDPDGTRNYGVPEQPYRLVGSDGLVHDYSAVGFPVWPNLTIGLPRDSGYSDLPAAARAKEDEMLRGIGDCASCHGDPDGGGPMMPPAQGDLAYTQPTRRACGACHDDWVWDQLYAANGTTMPPQLNDSECKQCHFPSGDRLAVLDGHRHPLLDPALNQGLVFELTALTDVGAAPANGVLESGEKLSVSFDLTDDLGAPVNAAGLDSISAVLAGPTSNSQLLLNTSLPPVWLSGQPPYTSNLPERVYTEYLGTSTASPQDSFLSARSPHWNVPGALTEVLVQTGTPSATNLAEAAVAGQNYVDVLDSTGFERGEIVALRTCPSGQPELLRIQWVDGDRLWFGSPYTPGYQPGLRSAHPLGECVVEVTLLQLTEGVHYDLEESSGTVTEIGDAFGSGSLVVASYTSDFVAPDAHGLALNDSPDLGETSGKWSGKSLVGGTYTLTMWGYREVSYDVVTGSKVETTTYRGTSVAQALDFAAVDADPGALEPYALIDGPQSCYSCHQDLWFHGGGRRGWESCLACHGTAGAEDRPRYVAAGAPDTTGVLVSFREMLHKIHAGADLANAVGYSVVGFGPPGAYPDNYSEATYGGVRYPFQPGATAACASCHGETNEAWKLPSDRNHPTEQVDPVLAWRQVCRSCHDSSQLVSHFDYGTTPAGVETCGGCHGLANDLSVLRVHASY